MPVLTLVAYHSRTRALRRDGDLHGRQRDAQHHLRKKAFRLYCVSCHHKATVMMMS
jgi:hypothetical protein